MAHNQIEMRGMWISSVVNLDWPSSLTLGISDDARRIQMQKAELLRILDEIASMGMNTAIFQVKPCADALYHSKLLPWSQYLTGVLGKDPGFDPLAYAVSAWRYCRV